MYIAPFKKSSKDFGKFFNFFSKKFRKRGMADRIAWIHGISLPERKEKQPETWLVIKMTY